MLDRIKLLAGFTLYWLAFMLVIKAIFLIYNHDLTHQLTASEIFLVFLYGLKMDASMSGYLLMFTSLMLTISVFTKSKAIIYIINTISILFLFLSCAVVIVDVELYRHWGFRLNTTPFLYIGPEAMGSIEPSVAIKNIVILLTLFIGFLFIYLRSLVPAMYKLKKSNWKVFTAMLVITALLFIPIRGSFTVAPMNTGFVYFHNTKAYANHAAINVIWNFFNSVMRGSEVVYPENFFNKKLAAEYVRELYVQGDSTTALVNAKKPNVLLIILESFTADVIEPLGGVENITPNLNKLCSEGILFDNFYASGDRTDKGIVSILSGYPAQPQSSIIKFPSKTQHLPYLTHYLNALGYHSSFVYGGDIDFSNFRSYLTNCQFEHITSRDDLPDEWYTSKWGIHDQYIFEHAQQECDSSTSPFFKVVLSLSSHEPFDVPMEPVIKGTDHESLFLNSCYYTDKVLGDFIHKAKQQPWWNNTLVIITADHGHRLPRNKEIKDKERFRIPMLWIGGAINKRDTVIHTIANQTDIANTLLAQLDTPHKEFNFSKNILSNNVNSFAVYFFNDGYGFVKPEQYIVYDNPGKQFLKSVNANKKDLNISKAYQQVLFEDYNKK
jgi:phosphoglycerol transferase MdoB-like AlkP superfamily enzyme